MPEFLNELNILLIKIDRHECLLENKALVKFERNYVRDPSGVFFTSSLASKDTDDAIARFFMAVCANN